MAMEEGASKETSLDRMEPVSWRCLLHSTNPVREDLLPRAGCKICAAKAAALNRIKAAGGDSVKAAKESASRAGADTLLVERAVVKTTAEGKAKPAEVVKKTITVPQAYIDELLVDPRIFPLRPLSEDFFQRNPNLREISLAGAATVLLSIEHDENILFQYFKKGFAVMEVEM